MNQAYSRLSTTHGHITNCKLDSYISSVLFTRIKNNTYGSAVSEKDISATLKILALYTACLKLFILVQWCVAEKKWKKFGEMHQLLLTASEHRVGTLPSELPQLREPVWTWLCNRVQYFKSIGTPNAAIADVWQFLSPTDDDQALFAIQIERELHCVNCDRVTTIKQAHTTFFCWHRALKR